MLKLLQQIILFEVVIDYMFNMRMHANLVELACMRVGSACHPALKKGDRRC